MKKAVNQWCFPNGTSFQEILRIGEKAGLNGIELNIYEPDGVGLTLETTETQAKEMKKLASSYGLELHSLSNGLLWKYPLSSPDREVRQYAARIVRKQLELASVMEIHTILLVPGLVNLETSYEQCWERSQQEVVELSIYAERLGVKIGVENVWNKFLLSPLDMVRYVDEIASANVGVYFDVGNVLNFGFPEQWIHSLGDRIFKVHVKDFLVSVGNISGFVPLFAGDVNWQAVLGALRDVNYDDYLTAELVPYKASSNQLIYDTSIHLSNLIDFM